MKTFFFTVHLIPLAKGRKKQKLTKLACCLRKNKFNASIDHFIHASSMVIIQRYTFFKKKEIVFYIQKTCATEILERINKYRHFITLRCIKVVFLSLFNYSDKWKKIKTWSSPPWHTRKRERVWEKLKLRSDLIIVLVWCEWKG